MVKTKETKGITLIALVVTIIILMILAGVTVSSLTSENGVINKAVLAKKMTETSNEQEAIELDVTLANMENRLDNSNRYYVGENLYDRTLENGDKWNIVVENDSQKVYGTGWNFIAKDTDIQNYGKTKYNWVVNYNNGEIKQINDDYTSLSYKSSLAVTDSLAMNIDATNLENDEWGDIEKHGDVKYSKENRSLYFDGDGDYLELTKNADFSNGFTFEIYANLERLQYDNGSGFKAHGMFCKMPSLNSSYTQSLRFGNTYARTFAKFNNGSTWSGRGDGLITLGTGAIQTDTDIYEQNKDFYLTFVYRRYNKESPQWSQVADRVEYYMDGELKGYTYYGIGSYDNGCRSWNTNDSNFYLGVCPWDKDGSLYYLKGNVYCARLYERDLNGDEIKENVNKTKIYRNLN